MSTSILSTSWAGKLLTIFSVRTSLTPRSTQASIIPEYCASTPPKKVDFCIYIDPSNNPPSPSSTISAQSAFERCRGELPGRVFNFTDFVPLDQRPIALSIETKKPSEGFDGAKLQLGVWQMAHWSFLRHLQYLAETSSKEDPTISALPLFIPGIIIQGHNWHLIITTLEEQKTFFWQKVLIGSTSSTKGIYQIIYVLHVLRRWVEDTYWPWLRDIVLRGWARPEITGNMVRPV